MVYTLFSLLTAVVDIPSMPEEIQEIILHVIDYISTGISLLANWTHLGYLLMLFGVVVAVDAGIMLYKLIMWFVRKIPMLGIE